MIETLNFIAGTFFAIVILFLATPDKK